MKENITPVGKASLENPVKILTATQHQCYFTHINIILHMLYAIVILLKL